MIPFAPPRVDDKTVKAVEEVLRSGWITTGPKTKLLEKKITEYCGCSSTLCLNSATAGLELALRWYGVGAGDEVILPAYTYAATANVVMHCGATPVLADVNKDDFNISLKSMEQKITAKTKVIMPVDFGGMPCDYEAILKIATENKKIFSPKGENQKGLGRIMVLADAAHSFGAYSNKKRTGSLTDISVFSFHAVKNLTTAEGGAMAFNLPAPFDNAEVYKELCIRSLHGQNKDALAKTQKGNWRYDIIEPGYKCNMTDLVAAIGLVELERYSGDTLEKRKYVIEYYQKAFSKYQWAELPLFKDDIRESSYHLYPLRIKGLSEEKRDAVIQKIFDKDVAVNVHFIPLPLLSFYKNMGYKIEDYPVTYDNYSREISLPVYYDITDEQLDTIVNAVIKSVEEICS
ncbi:MAG TPA: DegT/DnrJ/EryC1/StrS family aminotransferase [Bacteroidia bacterium]|jgi:dTDP-4-amino-4,6-dideoxygalactose transaminase|nr:DegT/DnrJ/EryC1/StrS family aminotransferase [Bacteroidia bacterium]